MANLKYDETFPVKVAEYAAKGDTDARIASRLGVALSTFYSYKEHFPEFAEGLLAGRRICYSRVRAILLKVARGQCKLTTKVFKNGELYKTTERNLPPNLKAIIYFQKHMRVGEVKHPAQQDSPASAGSILGERTEQTEQTNPSCPLPQDTPAQAGSGISNLGVSQSDQLAVRLVPPSGDPTEPQTPSCSTGLRNL